MTLPDTFDITTLREHHAALLSALDLGAPITIDASAVSRIDAAALQLLTAATIDARRRQLTLQILHPSPSFVNAAVVLGLESALGLSSH